MKAGGDGHRHTSGLQPPLGRPARSSRLFAIHIIVIASVESCPLNIHFPMLSERPGGKMYVISLCTNRLFVIIINLLIQKKYRDSG